jgi:hypothetical protein
MVAPVSLKLRAAVEIELDARKDFPKLIIHSLYQCVRNTPFPEDFCPLSLLTRRVQVLPVFTGTNGNR